MHFAIQSWHEVQEQLRLNKIYQGLRVSDDRPRYIFHGDGRGPEYWLHHQPHRKTKAIFPPLGSIKTKDGIKIPGLKTLFRPIMGASPGDYYVANAGDLDVVAN